MSAKPATNGGLTQCWSCRKLDLYGVVVPPQAFCLVTHFMNSKTSGTFGYIWKAPVLLAVLLVHHCFQHVLTSVFKVPPAFMGVAISIYFPHTHGWPWKY